MLVFHEGLPGAGKSYEACVYHIIPQLIEGRRVLTNIEGINHDKFSEITNIPVQVLRKMLVCVDHQDIEDPEEKYEAQKRSILDESGNDTLIVIDEIQDMFPSQRQKLSTEWSKYVGSHRHDGNDIIMMGQSFKDVHTFWRRRTQRKIVFTKKSALGQNDTYLWEAFEATQPEKFIKLGSGTRKYENKYFGLYESVTSTTKNTDVYADQRTLVWNNPIFKVYIPAALIAGFFAIKYLFGFFTPDDNQQEPPNVEAHRFEVGEPLPPQPEITLNEQPLPESHVPAQPVQPEYDPIDIFDELANKHRPRLAGVIRSTKKLIANVQIIDSGERVIDVFTQTELLDMGWSLTYRDSGLIVQKDEVKYLIRQWPVESWGRLNNNQLASFGSSSVARTTERPTSSISKPSSYIIGHSPAERRERHHHV